MRRSVFTATALTLALGCDALGGRELQSTAITANAPFSIVVPVGAGARSVWVGFDDDQRSHFEFEGEITASPPGLNALTFPVHFNANQFTQGTTNPCPNPTGQGPGRCVSTNSFNFRTFNRDVSGRTFLFDVPPSTAPVPLTGQLRRRVGDGTAPQALRIVITG